MVVTLGSRRAPGARRAWSHLVEATRPHLQALTGPERAHLEKILREDVLSEYDARFLTRHVEGLGLELSQPFQEAFATWAEDEERHFRHTFEVYRSGWGSEHLALGERRPDFAPLAPVFHDELSILCLFAYDELATVRAYRANLDWYARLGPAYREWAGALVADEAWHYATFLGVLRDQHADRLGDLGPVLDRVVALEGTPYAATFVLDHDDPVFSPAILADAEQVLRRHLSAGSRRQP